MLVNECVRAEARPHCVRLSAQGRDAEVKMNTAHAQLRSFSNKTLQGASRAVVGTRVCRGCESKAVMGSIVCQRPRAAVPVARAREGTARASVACGWDRVGR